MGVADVDSGSGVPGSAAGGSERLGPEDGDRDACCDLPAAHADTTGCSAPRDLVAPTRVVDAVVVAPPA